ncbi:hypothetical protein [Streptomyces sp. NPDC050485]|uniref:hypothetical protein n=1 Tax=Streptomyces sp. NPDC050485 TaxID=3365617 RepID=UPI0037BB7D96
MDEDELHGDPSRCVELSLEHIRVEDGHLTVRLAPADIVLLRMETESVLDAMRAEVIRAEIAWETALGEWYEEGRAAVESREPDTALLARVLEALHRANAAALPALPEKEGVGEEVAGAFVEFGRAS